MLWGQEMEMCSTIAVKAQILETNILKSTNFNLQIKTKMICIEE